MRIKINFLGGPIHGQRSDTTELPQLKMFWPPEERVVHVYFRHNETEYVYSRKLSDDLTAIYDQARERFKPAPYPDSELFSEEPIEDFPDSSSD